MHAPHPWLTSVAGRKPCQCLRLASGNGMPDVGRLGGSQVSAQPKVFTEQVVQLMCRLNPRPVIFPLSNPTTLSGRQRSAPIARAS